MIIRFLILVFCILAPFESISQVSMTLQAVMDSKGSPKSSGRTKQGDFFITYSGKVKHPEGDYFEDSFFFFDEQNKCFLATYSFPTRLLPYFIDYLNQEFEKVSSLKWKSSEVAIYIVEGQNGNMILNTGLIDSMR